MERTLNSQNCKGKHCLKLLKVQFRPHIIATIKVGLILIAMFFQWNVVNSKETDSLREVSLIISDEGFYPQRISVFEGEQVRFFITSLTKAPSCFMLPSHEVFVGVPKGQIVGTQVRFTKKGKFKFHCPAGKAVGLVTVLERKEGEMIKRSRNQLQSSKLFITLSEDANKEKWVPKDF